jgi:GT2 family glycosyltransferase
MLPAELPFVSIVTLNYNQTSVTCDFLESSRNLTYPRYEILVGDMASTVNPESAILSLQVPHTKLFLSDTNLGFAAGNNWLMRKTDAEFIFIVNNDTVLNPNLIQDLLEPFYQDAKIGVVCPKIKFYDNPNMIQYAGYQPMHPITGRTSEIGGKELDQGQYDLSRETFGAHGCAMMVRRNVIDKVGMFPELFFLYYEEWDWSARILRAGFTIWYAGNAYILHKESMSVGKLNPMKVYYHTRNRILYMRRNAGLLQYIIFILFFTFFSLPKATFQFLSNLQFQHLKNLYKGWWWNIWNSSRSVV